MEQLQNVVLTAGLAACGAWWLGGAALVSRGAAGGAFAGVVVALLRLCATACHCQCHGSGTRRSRFLLRPPRTMAQGAAPLGGAHARRIWLELTGCSL